MEIFDDSASLTLLLTCGETAKKISTAMLYEYAVTSINLDKSQTVIFSRPNPFDRMPPLMPSASEATYDVLRRIELIYTPNRRDFVEFVANLEPATISSVLIVESLETYRTSTTDVSIVAFLQDTFAWKYKKQRSGGVQVQPSAMIASLHLASEDQSSSIVRIFTKNLFRLVDDDRSTTARLKNAQDVELYRCQLSADETKVNVVKIGGG